MTTNLTDKNGTTTPTRKEGAKMAGPAKPAPARKDGSHQKLIKYLQEVLAELKKTSWPDRPKLIASTKVVLGAVIVTGFYLFVIDWVLTQVMGFFIGARGR
jgi:preprotein translocase subunit SecE